jgi:hypothetical protein
VVSPQLMGRRGRRSTSGGKIGVEDRRPQGRHEPRDHPGSP